MSMPEFRIAGRPIGYHHEPLVIAEIGINHGGRLDVACAMADAAAAAGAEIIKHQTHVIEDEMTEDAKSIIPGNTDVSIWEVMETNRLTLEEEAKFKAHVEGLGMIYLSTPFSRAAADWLQEQDVPAFKIGSGEIDNLPLIRHVAGFGKPMILSTGMQDVEGVRAAVEIVRAAGTPFALLHCVNLYPTPPELLRLGAIAELQSAFPDAVIGYSDHSLNNVPCHGALALGAAIIERHFTDSRTRPGPDILCSMEPQELRELIASAHVLRLARGGRKGRAAEEEVTYRFARASVVTIAPVAAGDVFDERNLWVRRPGTGEIAARDFDAVLGKRAARDVAPGKQLAWADVAS